jgi:hypothetical protein
MCTDLPLPGKQAPASQSRNLVAPAASLDGGEKDLQDEHHILPHPPIAFTLWLDESKALTKLVLGLLSPPPPAWELGS